MEEQFAVTYDPLLNSIYGIIRKNIYLLDKVKEVFSPQVMVFFRSTLKLSSDLLRAKLIPFERRVGSYKYCNIPNNLRIIFSKCYHAKNN